MNAQQYILTDCDGCLLGWESEFHKWMNEQGHIKNVHAAGMYDMETMYSLDKQTVVDMVEAFNTSARIFDLPAFRDARSGVARLVEAGYKFICISSITDNKTTHRLREMNLANIFGADVFTSLITLGTDNSKRATLQSYADIDNFWWIDDKWENVIDGADVGLRSIVIDHSYNQFEDSRVSRVNDWDGVCKLILGK